MKRLSPIAYRALFFKHVWRFLGNVTISKELSGPHVVAVSGGLDSMCLLWFAQSLHKQGKIGPVRAVFVHHHTREGQDEDGELVKKFCKEEGIPFKMLHVEGLTAKVANFEAKARKKRRELCINDLRANELLWAGHHLDDSYEWNLMQRNRSTNPKAAVGIPVRNRAIVRPFSCVSKAQIRRLAKFEGIPFREDPTNRDLKYDRNFVRYKIIPLIKERYPKYLKFYSHYANFSTMMLKTNIMSRSGTSKIFVFEQGAVLVGSHYSEIQIQEIIHTYSNTDRGEIITPIERMLRAIDNGKKGPFHFSGGMEAFSNNTVLMIYQQGLKNYDEQIARTLSTLTTNQLMSMSTYKRIELEYAWQNLLQSPDAMLNMPGLVLVLETESICKTLNTSVFNELFPRVSEVCKERGLRFITFQKCLDTWMSKKEKLPERLRLLPLSNLSNLFASQQ
ncbi:tRNA lysidine(34) synthetase TilS [Peredibacter sp. HCB2-198]|uniref:tRNA lysidine(34) synthetase TilS n=1 Tax=Peredibacter sp. HCB2-198 TaxID=3383025 RepID=UPI0038B5E4C8